MGGFHLAQVNIALPLEPLDSERLREFVAQLDPVNAVADHSDGFVWRLQTDEGDATDVRGFDDERLIINMSVWESMKALRAFVYSNRAHLDVMRRRREWFDRLPSYLVLWWIPAGHLPTVPEAEGRFALLRAVGPSPDAFTFRHHFAPPDSERIDAVRDDRDLCPA
jgi:Domain of unknown function (DUF3291)